MHTKTMLKCLYLAVLIFAIFTMLEAAYNLEHKLLYWISISLLLMEINKSIAA